MENKRRKNQKKNKKPIYIALGIVSVGFISVGSFFALKQMKESKKEKVVQSFISNFEKKDFKDLVNTLDEESIKTNKLTKNYMIAPQSKP